MISIFLDALQIHSNTANLGLVVKQPITGLEMPPIRFSEYDKIGEWGSAVTNQLYGGRVITFNGLVFSSNLTTFQTNRRLLENEVQIAKDSNSVPIAKLLKFTTMDSLALQCNVYLQTFQMDVTQVNKADFQMVLFSPDFGLESQSQQNVVLGTQTGGGVVIPVIFPMVLGASSGGTAAATNNGNVNAWPVITLNGPLTNPTIQNNTTGRTMSLTVTLQSGQSIIIDMKNKTLTQNGSPVLSTLVSGFQWWWLQPGSNNIQIITTSNGNTGNANIAFRDTYIGV